MRGSFVASPTYRICVKCGFRVSLEMGLPPHFCPKPASVKVFTEEERKEFEKKRREEEAKRPPRKKVEAKKLGTNFSMLANRVNQERRQRERG